MSWRMIEITIKEANDIAIDISINMSIDIFIDLSDSPDKKGQLHGSANKQAWVIKERLLVG